MDLGLPPGAGVGWARAKAAVTVQRSESGGLWGEPQVLESAHPGSNSLLPLAVCFLLLHFLGPQFPHLRNEGSK